MPPHLFSRRESLAHGLGAIAGLWGSTHWLAAAETEKNSREQAFEFRYILGSCMYGYTPVEEVVPEVKKIGATAIDIWPKVHGSQREDLDRLGEEKFAELLHNHDVQLGCITQYKLGPFGLQDEMRMAQRLGCSVIVTGAKGPKGLTGDELKAGLRTFIDEMQPHLAVAEETGVTIAIENHGNNLVDSPDSIRWLLELCPSPNLGLAMAPYHLPQETEVLCSLIRDAGDRLKMFYAWQHGMGCMEKLPKEQELLQLPGRGDLGFGPLVKTLRETKYQGWTEIFMHPVPRGVPILDTTAEVTAEINRARDHLAGLI
ncbi:MAG: sugar phosphate isomerase/epimerase [Planctomycetaceae bacterium]|nr:sugar phosphate isomerase/epimerase [Planctomycetaceae bacterium]